MMPTSYAACAFRSSEDDRLYLLAREFRACRSRFQSFLIAGFFIWPLWIVAYIEWNRMRDLKMQVRLLGVDVAWWERTW